MEKFYVRFYYPALNTYINEGKRKTEDSDRRSPMNYLLLSGLLKGFPKTWASALDKALNLSQLKARF